MFRTIKISAQDHARLGSEAFGQGDWGEAVEHYTQALEAKPSFGLYVNLGHCYTRLERWAEAASAYEAAMELDSESATGQIWRFLAQAQYNAGEFPEAMEAFFEAGLLKADGRDDIWIARCMIELEQWVQSRSVLLGHLRRNPTDTEALELLAYVIGQQGDWPGVIEVYRQLLIAGCPGERNTALLWPTRWRRTAGTSRPLTRWNSHGEWTGSSPRGPIACWPISIWRRQCRGRRRRVTPDS